MEITVTVTHTIAPEIVSLLQGLYSTRNSAQTTKVVPNSTEKTTEQPEEEKPVVKPEAKAKVAKASFTIEQVRSAVQIKAQSGKRENVKALLTKYGAESVTAVDASKYSEFLTDDEITKVLGGFEMWLDCDEIRERLAQRDDYLEAKFLAEQEEMKAQQAQQEKDVSKPQRKKKN